VTRHAAICFVCFALACGDDDASGPTDAGPRIDSGIRVDAGPPGDAGPPFDAGPLPPGTDAGMPASDAGPGDRMIEEFVREGLPNIAFGCCRHQVDLAIASDGTPRIFGYQERSRDNWLGDRSSGSWEETNVTEAAGLDRGSERSAMVLDADDEMHAVYTDTGVLSYVARDGDSWVTAVVDPDSSVTSPFFTHFDIAVDADGDPHIVWLDGRSLNYASWNGSGFDIEVIEAPEGDEDQVGEFARIAVASDGTVYVSCLAIVGEESALRLATGTAGSWSLEDVPGMGRGVHGTVLLDADDNPHVVSTGFVGGRAIGLYWSAFDGSSWTETQLEDERAFVDVEADLDSLGRAHAAGSINVGAAGYPVYVYPFGDGYELFQVRTPGAPVGDPPESIGFALDEDDEAHLTTGSYYTFR